MQFYIIEEDGGWNDSINVSLSVQGVGSLSVALPACSFDNVLFNASWIRYSFITDMDTTNNTNTMMFDSGNTLKTKMEISDRPY